jgi:hypothetical protein
LGKIGNRNVRVISNGFDWDFDPNEERAPLSKEFTLTHLGVVGPTRNAPVFWQALQELKNEIDGFGKALKIKFVGHVDQSVVQSLDSRGLTENTEFIAHVPHNEVKQFQESSQVLLLLINDAPNAKGIVTGKLYEYLASLRPILAIGPEEGDAARILNEAHAGTTVDFNDKKRMKEMVLEYYQRYLSNSLPNNSAATIEKYSRRALAGEYARLLNKIE